MLLSFIYMSVFFCLFFFLAFPDTVPPPDNLPNHTKEKHSTFPKWGSPGLKRMAVSGSGTQAGAVLDLWETSSDTGPHSGSHVHRRAVLVTSHLRATQQLLGRNCSQGSSCIWERPLDLRI